MSTLYLMTEYGKLQKKNEHLMFRNKDDKETPILMSDADQIVIGAPVSITGEALDLLCRNKIPVSIMSRTGHYKTRLEYAEPKNVFVRIKQMELYLNKGKNLDTARSIVNGKIRNQSIFMKRIARNTRYSDFKKEITAAAEKVDKIRNNLQRATSLDSLRGYEGNASKLYFNVLRYNITPEWAEFTERSTRPPKSNVNAVLSFLYTLLTNYVETAAMSCTLDTMIGTMHSVEYGNLSLVYDLMEEFRTPLCDTVCCAMFNMGILCNDDFEFCDDGAVYLTDKGMSKAIEAFELKLQEGIYYTGENRICSYKEIIFFQAKQYRTYIDGKKKKYDSFAFR